LLRCAFCKSRISHRIWRTSSSAMPHILS
jgi:hypothetical protein